MRTAGVVSAALLALVAAGCGGDSGPKRSDYAASLASLCTDARQQVEALGRPSDHTLAEIYPPTVRIGRGLVRDIGRLHPEAGERVRARELTAGLRNYYDGLAI